MVAHPAEFGQDFGVPRMSDAGLMQGQLVKRQRGDRIDPAGHGELGGRDEELERRTAGSGVDCPGSDVSQIVGYSVDIQAGDDAWRGLGLFGGGESLDSWRVLISDELACALERSESPMTSGRAKECKRGSAQPLTMTSGPMPATSPIVRAIRGTFSFITEALRSERPRLLS